MGRPAHLVKIYIEKRRIRFPNGYYFVVSPVNNRKEIVREEISEVYLDTQPPSLLLKSHEIIFLKKSLRPNLELFAHLNHIPMRNPIDIWEHINRPFLDNQFDKFEKENSIRQLSALGLTETEIARIRKRVAPTMLRNLIVWKTTYLGLYDYLQWSYLNPKKYQWAMSIALKGIPSTRILFPQHPTNKAH